MVIKMFQYQVSLLGINEIRLIFFPPKIFAKLMFDNTAIWEHVCNAKQHDKV